jgi:hypothetical protein
MRAPLLDAQIFNPELLAPLRRQRGADLSASGQEDGEKEGQGDRESG